MKRKVGSFEARPHEKEESRAMDARDLADGKKSQDQLRSENGRFVFPNAQLLLDRAKALA